MPTAARGAGIQGMYVVIKDRQLALYPQRQNTPVRTVRGVSPSTGGEGQPRVKFMTALPHNLFEQPARSPLDEESWLVGWTLWARLGVTVRGLK